jgi:hypothetical protein
LHPVYRIWMLSLESDIFIRQSPIDRIWILKNTFGVKIISCVYIPRHHSGNWIIPFSLPCMHVTYMMTSARITLGLKL